MHNVRIFATIILLLFCFPTENQAQNNAFVSVFDGAGVLTLTYNEIGHEIWGQLSIGSQNCSGSIRGHLSTDWVEAEQSSYYVLTAANGCVVRIRLGDISIATETPECAFFHGVSCQFAGSWRLRR